MSRKGKPEEYEKEIWGESVCVCVRKEIKSDRILVQISHDYPVHASELS